MRTYGEACGIAHALDLVGERWALLVVRELLLGPKRFTDIRSGLPAASPNVLAQRLRELESASVVRRRRLPPPAGSSVYELTDWGRQLEPIVISLGTWGAQAPSFGPEGLVSVDSIALAFRALFDPDAADGLDACFGLRLGDSRFRVRIAGGAIEVERGETPGADATIETDGTTLRDVLWGGRDLEDALNAGDVRIEGDRRAASRFVRLFPQPQPAAAA